MDATILSSKIRENNEIDLNTLLSSDRSAEEPRNYIQITPEIVAVFSLRDCEDQLSRANEEKLRLARAMKSAHLAVQAALISALAGSMNIGAHPEKLRLKKLRYFQEGEGEYPDSDRVMSFDELMARAITEPLAWTGKPLSLEPHEQDLLARLCLLRDGIEHPKQMHWSIEIAYILEVIPLAVNTAVKLLEVVGHHLRPGELVELQELAAQVATHCGTLKEAS